MKSDFARYGSVRDRRINTTRLLYATVYESYYRLRYSLIKNDMPQAGHVYKRTRDLFDSLHFDLIRDGNIMELQSFVKAVQTIIIKAGRCQTMRNGFGKESESLIR